MPRPGATSGKSSSNPLASFKERREAKKRDKLEQAARLITNKTAENENKMADLLGGIDFIHSKLPKEVLDFKTNPNQKYGDLEYTVLAIRNLIITNPQDLRMDIRKIDERILALVLMLKEAVEQGDTNAAYTAKAGLLRGINDIRNRIPQNQPELAKAFVEQNAAYLDGWITLIGTAKSVDMKERNLKTERTQFEEKRAQIRLKEEDFKTKMTTVTGENIEDAEALYKILEHDLPEERLKWTDKEREIHRALVEFALDKNVFNIRSTKLEQDEMSLSASKSRLETMFTAVSTLPIVIDPNLLNKQAEAIDNMMRSLAETDTFIDETLKTMDELDGRIKQLDSAPGTIRAKEVANNAAINLAAELKKEQNRQTGGGLRQIEEYRERLGILNEEEFKERQQEWEQEQASVLASLELEDTVEETEETLNYN